MAGRAKRRGNTVAVALGNKQFRSPGCHTTIQCVYDVTAFLKTCKEEYFDPDGYLERFSFALDDKIRISPDNTIYRDIETIVDKICAELYKLDADSYENITKHRTGSSYSDLKVGVPHEADFLLEIHDDLLSCRDFQKHMRRLIKQMKLIDDTQHWVLHGVENHKVGVCLVMEYRPDGPEGRSEGVTVDLVPVLRVPSRRTQTLELTLNAEMYLRNHNEYYKQNTWDSDIYLLCGSAINSSSNVFDTGLMEGNILMGLDPDVKRGLRIAKYLIQQYITKEYALHDDLVGKKRGMKLYGYAPEIRSHYLRHCFLHLLMRVKGTEIEGKLKGGVLALCLMDMMRCMFEHNQKVTVTEFHFTHPIQKYGSSVFHTVTFGVGYINTIVQPFLLHAKEGDISSYTLLNSDRTMLTSLPEGTSSRPKYAADSNAPDIESEVNAHMADAHARIADMKSSNRKHMREMQSGICIRIARILLCSPNLGKGFDFMNEDDDSADENTPLIE